MELVFEMLNASQFVPAQLCQKTFTQAGGLIGRGSECDWVVPDRKRHLSNRHASITCRDGAFFLTDISRNGIQHGGSGARLHKGEPVRIEHGSVYVLGDFQIRARLVGNCAIFPGEVGRHQVSGGLIPDDAFLDRDPLQALKQQKPVHSEFGDVLAPNLGSEGARQCVDYARIDRERLIVPELVDAPSAAEPAPVLDVIEHQNEGFWDRFGAALGLDVSGLDKAAREALAVDAARLLQHSIGGLQQALRTCNELKNELGLAQAPVEGTHKNPLKGDLGTGEALALLLQPEAPDPVPAEQAVSRAFGDVQAHQVALVSASRAMVRGLLEQFSPERLVMSFELDNKPLMATSGSRWKAYGRYFHALRQDDGWSERVLARDFAQAYEEQVRLISTLSIDCQGCC
jgi:type VI secretion system protein ImpI